MKIDFINLYTLVLMAAWIHSVLSHPRGRMGIVQDVIIKLVSIAIPMPMLLRIWGVV